MSTNHDDICVKCGQRFGDHSGIKLYCPNPSYGMVGQHRWMETQSFTYVATLQDSQTAVHRGGMMCSGGCGNFNEYAEPNRPDGSFVCYSCRNR